jgi:hypothetical protein
MEETILIFYYRNDEEEQNVPFEVTGSGRPSTSSELMDGKFLIWCHKSAMGKFIITVRAAKYLGDNYKFVTKQQIYSRFDGELRTVVYIADERDGACFSVLVNKKYNSITAIQYTSLCTVHLYEGELVNTSQMELK